MNRPYPASMSDHKACRTEEQAQAAVDAHNEAQQGCTERTYRRWNAIAAGYYAEAIALIEQAQARIAEAEPYLDIGSAFDPRGLTDECTDLRVMIERLGQ